MLGHKLGYGDPAKMSVALGSSWLGRSPPLLIIRIELRRTYCTAPHIILLDMISFAGPDLFRYRIVTNVDHFMEKSSLVNFETFEVRPLRLSIVMLGLADSSSRAQGFWHQTGPFGELERWRGLVELGNTFI